MTKVRASGTSISLNELEDFNFFRRALRSDGAGGVVGG